jgi:hypothetical protein
MVEDARRSNQGHSEALFLNIGVFILYVLSNR